MDSRILIAADQIIDLNDYILYRIEKDWLGVKAEEEQGEQGELDISWRWVENSYIINTDRNILIFIPMSNQMLPSLENSTSGEIYAMQPLMIIDKSSNTKVYNIEYVQFSLGISPAYTGYKHEDSPQNTFCVTYFMLGGKTYWFISTIEQNIEHVQLHDSLDELGSVIKFLGEIEYKDVNRIEIKGETFNLFSIYSYMTLDTCKYDIALNKEHFYLIHREVDRIITNREPISKLCVKLKGFNLSSHSNQELINKRVNIRIKNSIFKSIKLTPFKLGLTGGDMNIFEVYWRISVSIMMAIYASIVTSCIFIMMQLRYTMLATLIVLWVTVLGKALIDIVNSIALHGSRNVFNYVIRKNR